MKERIQKIIAYSGYCSRRKAEEFIRAGKVFVNGKIAKIGDKADINIDRIEIDGYLLERKKPVYYMLNKPVEVIVSKKDEKGRRTIYDLSVVKSIKENVLPVGRLDYMSEGLLLLTNDGEWANKIAHPRYEIKKIYEVELADAIKDSDIEKIENGIIIDDKKTSKARVIKIKPGKIQIMIHEGRNRIIRKIMAELDYKIKSLKRIQIGKYKLNDLKPGEIKKVAC